MPEDQSEARYLLLWIAFNSLYSRWNAERNAPEVDTSGRRDVLHRVCELDPAAIGAMLKKNRGLVNKLLSSPHLSNVFWREPENPKSIGRATEDKNHLDHHLHHGEWCRLLEQVMERLYVLRGQIVHGASTGGSRLNRSSIRYCLMMLDLLVPVVQQIVIEHGCGDDWPELCYPPLKP